MSEQFAARVGRSEKQAHLDSILGRLHDLGDLGDPDGTSVAERPALQSVPDLPPEHGAADEVTEPVIVAPPALTLVETGPMAGEPSTEIVAPAPIADSAAIELAKPSQTGFLADYRPKRNDDAHVVEREPEPEPGSVEARRIRSARLAGRTLPSAAIAPERPNGSSADLPAAATQPSPPQESPPQEPVPNETAELVEPVVEKVDYFADLDSAEPVAIAGVNDRYFADYVDPDDHAQTITANNDTFSLPQPVVDAVTPVEPDDATGDGVPDVLANPLAITDARRSEYGAEMFDVDHGVAFPETGTTIPLPPTPNKEQIEAMTTTKVSANAISTNDDLTTKQLIIATILFAILVFAMLSFADSMLALDVDRGLERLFG